MQSMRIALLLGAAMVGGNLFPAEAQAQLWGLGPAVSQYAQNGVTGQNLVNAIRQLQAERNLLRYGQQPGVWRVGPFSGPFQGVQGPPYGNAFGHDKSQLPRGRRFNPGQRGFPFQSFPGNGRPFRGFRQNFGGRSFGRGRGRGRR